MNDKNTSGFTNFEYSRPKDWNPIIKDYLKIKDKITLRDYCDAKNLSFGSFKTRLYKSTAYRKLFPRSPSDFIEAKIVDDKPYIKNKSNSLECTGSYKLTFSSNIELLVPDDFDDNSLRRLIGVLS